MISLKRKNERKDGSGNWELHLSGSKDKVGDVIKLIDDSQSTTNPQGIGGRVFNVVSGSISSGTSDIRNRTYEKSVVVLVCSILT